MAVFPVLIVLLVRPGSARCSSALLVGKFSQRIYPQTADEETGICRLPIFSKPQARPCTTVFSRWSRPQRRLWGGLVQPQAERGCNRG